MYLLGALDLKCIIQLSGVIASLRQVVYDVMAYLVHAALNPETPLDYIMRGMHGEEEVGLELIPGMMVRVLLLKRLEMTWLGLVLLFLVHMFSQVNSGGS